MLSTEKVPVSELCDWSLPVARTVSMWLPSAALVEFQERVKGLDETVPTGWSSTKNCTLWVPVPAEAAKDAVWPET